MLVGIIGNDAAGRELATLIESRNGVRLRTVALDDRPTIEKTRFVSHGHHMLRIDRELTGPPDVWAQADIVRIVAEELRHHDAVVLSDYAKGTLTDQVVREIIALCSAQGKPVVVDPKSTVLSKYDGATVITPNRSETEAATGIHPSEDASAERAGLSILESTSIQAVLITRAERGMTLVRREAPTLNLPAHARDVFDVVGAGDTVVGVLAACLGAGWPLEDGARLANIAAGIVVTKEGTATVSQTEILDELNAGVGLDHAELNRKVMSWPMARSRCRVWLRDGKSVGFTNGCFDVLHAGHIHLLQFARASCDRLVVAINSDVSVRRLKGSSRPVNKEEDRAVVLSAVRYVDAVIVFDQDTPKEAIEFLEPSVLVKGADYAIDQIVGAEYILSRGGRVLICELLAGRSTTQTISRIKEPST
jgi:D-beta-D-heptose 7-phosphate kinase/D-beta-D-heptose 1-phosphate adenosyltransferase